MPVRFDVAALKCTDPHEALAKNMHRDARARCAARPNGGEAFSQRASTGMHRITCGPLRDARSWTLRKKNALGCTDHLRCIRVH